MARDPSDVAANSESSSGLALVADVPAGQDAFGTHDSIAAALQRLINTEDGGRAVALAGSYGSGKSTVVLQLANRLTASNGPLLWVFDAWAHEGDPLRRTFLEKLIRFLLDQKLIAQKHWNKELKKLGKRTRETEATTTPRLSKTGVLVAVSALFMPIGSALLAHGLRDGITPPPGPPNWVFWSGILFTLLPALVAAFCILLSASRDRRERGDEELDWATHFSVFFNKEVTDHSTETWETPEPTSVEFERIFHDVMSEALLEGRQKLVIVLDNLDRVAPDDALAIWSTLQPFLHGSKGQAPWKASTWFVVPYDRAAIRRLWRARRVGPNDSEGIAAAFLDKTFEVTFHVPFPVVSNQRAYLLDLLERALPNEDADERYLVQRVFRSLRGKELPPTPREIKNYVNSLVVLRHVHGPSLPLSHLAYFALLKKEDPDVLVGLKEGSVPEESARAMLGPALADNLARLELGVDREVARQLLLGPPIREAMEAGEAETLQKLQESARGFGDVLDDVVRVEIREWTPAQALLAAHALSRSGVLSRLEAPPRTLILDEFRRALTSWKPSVPAIDRIGEYLGDLAVLVDDRGFAAEVLSFYKELAETLAEPEDEGSQHVTAAGVVSDLSELLPRLATAGFDRPQDVRICLDSNTESVSKALLSKRLEEEPQERRVEIREILETTDADEAVVEYFRKLVETGNWSSSGDRGLRIFLSKRPEAEWGEVSAAIVRRLEPAESIGPPERQQLLQSLVHLTARIQDTATLPKLARNGRLAHHFQVASEGTTKSLCLYLLLKHNPELEQQENIGDSALGTESAARFVSSPDADQLEPLVALLTEERGIEFLFQLMDRRNDADPLVGQALARLLDEPWVADRLTAERLLSVWKPLGQAAGGIEDVLKLLKLNPKIAKHLGERDFLVRDAPLYLAILRTYPSRRPQGFLSWVGTGLQSLDSDQWLVHLGREGNMLRLAAEVRKHDSDFDLTGSFREACTAHAREVLSGEREVREPRRVREALAALDPDQRAVLRDEIWELARTASSGVPNRFLQVWGDELSGSKRFRGDPGTVQQLIVPALKRQEIDFLVWLEERLSKEPDLLQAIDASYRNVLVQELEEAVGEDSPEDFSGAVAKLRVHLGAE